MFGQTYTWWGDSPKKQIMRVIESRGYGPWDQWQAWQSVQDIPMDNLEWLFYKLDANYPPRDLTRGEEV